MSEVLAYSCIDAYLRGAFQKLKIPRNDPCPCRSGKKAKNCCGPPGDGRIPPINIDLNPNNTDFGHPKCYLSALGGCSKKISGEHYQSKGILLEIGNDTAGAGLLVSGSPWTKDGEFKSIGIDSLTANILCVDHNTALSPLDSVGRDFYKALRRFTRPRPAIQEHIAFNGHDIERWILKTLFGFVFSGVSRADNDTRVDPSWARKLHLHWVADSTPWINLPHMGLYYLRNDNLSSQRHGAGIKFRANLNNTLKTIDGAKISICGVEFILCASPRPLYPSNEGYRFIFRPKRFEFITSQGSSCLHFSWNDGLEHPVIKKKHVGSVKE